MTVFAARSPVEASSAAIDFVNVTCSTRSSSARRTRACAPRSAPVGATAPTISPRIAHKTTVRRSSPAVAAARIASGHITICRIPIAARWRRSQPARAASERRSASRLRPGGPIRKTSSPSTSSRSGQLEARRRVTTATRYPRRASASACTRVCRVVPPTEGSKSGTAKTTIPEMGPRAEPVGEPLLVRSRGVAMVASERRCG